MATEKQIIDEIVEKVEHDEATATAFMASVAEWGDLYKVRPPKRAERTFSNPRQTEFHRAAMVNAILEYRMLTSADPFFEARSLSLNTDYDKIDTLKHVWKTQLEAANYRANLMRALTFKPVYGTVICQEDYRIIGASPFGRRLPVTTMTPRAMDQVFFDRAGLNFDEADWVATADITSKHALMQLAAEAKQLGAPWHPKALEAAAHAAESKNTINFRVMERLRRSGFTDEEALSKKKEILMYYGKLDCCHDGIEYVAALINRKYLIRFHANNFQHGRRGFSIAKHIDFDQLRGYGLGDILGHQHRGMDANRQKAQDLGSFGAYNMWGRRKNSFADEDATIAPLQFVDMDSKDDMWPITPDYRALEGILRLDDILKAEFRATSNATDTLQAIVTDATATASALAQNEALRAVSVRAEHSATPLVRRHLENNHWNNIQNIRAPFNINKAGVATRVYPSDMMIDVQIEAKVTTDKDFQPKRLEYLLRELQILTSTKSDHPDQAQVSILPIIKAISSMLEVNPNEVITAPGRNGLPVAPSMGAQDLLGMAGLMTPGPGGPLATVRTPVGPVLAAA